MMYSQIQSDRMSQNQSLCRCAECEKCPSYINPYEWAEATHGPRIPTFQEDPEGFVVKCFQFQLELISKMTAGEITHAEGMKMLKEKFPTVVSDSEDDEDEEQPKEQPKEDVEQFQMELMTKLRAKEITLVEGMKMLIEKFPTVVSDSEDDEDEEEPKEQPKEEVEQYTECECCDRICYTGGVQYPDGYCCEDCEPEENSDDSDDE